MGDAPRSGATHVEDYEASARENRRRPGRRPLGPDNARLLGTPLAEVHLPAAPRQVGDPELTVSRGDFSRGDVSLCLSVRGTSCLEGRGETLYLVPPSSGKIQKKKKKKKQPHHNSPVTNG